MTFLYCMTPSMFKDLSPVLLDKPKINLLGSKTCPRSEEAHQIKRWSPTSWKTTLVHVLWQAATQPRHQSNFAWNFELYSLFVLWSLRRKKSFYLTWYEEVERILAADPPNRDIVGEFDPDGENKNIPTSQPFPYKWAWDTGHHLAELMSFALTDPGRISSWL